MSRSRTLRFWPHTSWCQDPCLTHCVIVCFPRSPPLMCSVIPLFVVVCNVLCVFSSATLRTPPMLTPLIGAQLQRIKPIVNWPKLLIVIHSHLLATFKPCSCRPWMPVPTVIWAGSLIHQFVNCVILHTYSTHSSSSHRGNVGVLWKDTSTHVGPRI